MLGKGLGVFVLSHGSRDFKSWRARFSLDTWPREYITSVGSFSNSQTHTTMTNEQASSLDDLELPSEHLATSPAEEPESPTESEAYDVGRRNGWLAYAVVDAEEF